MRTCMLRSLFLICFFILPRGTCGQVDERNAGPPSGESEKSEKTVNVARLIVKGQLPETAEQPGFFGELQPNLRQLVGRLDEAATDENVSAVVLRLQNPQIGRGKLAELRAAVKRVRSTGKKVYAQLQLATARDYLLACACDTIVMPESGTFFVTGIHTEIAFFKDLLEKFDVEADLIQVGDYKGAAEPFTRDSMSDEYREQFESLVEDLYEHLIETIASERNLEVQKVRQLIDIGMLTAAEAQQAGLIDQVAYDRQFTDQIKRANEADRLVMVEDYGKKKADLDFSGLMGITKMFELFSGSKSSDRSSRAKKIAVVYVAGPIMTGKSIPGFYGGQTVGSDTIVEALKKAEDHNRVVATVLRVDSPGGSAIASDQIWKSIVDAEKPVVASMGDIAASGGYYISMGCDKIFAEPETLTGSIGVVGGKIALGKMMGNVGINVETIRRGKNSGLMSTQSTFTDSEREVWLKTMKESYRQFVTKAAQGRDMDADKMETLAAGRLWTGRQAQSNGLVDQIGSLSEAIDAAKQLAGLAQDEKIELIILPEPKSVLDRLSEGSLFGAAVQKGTEALIPGASTSLREIELMKRLFSEPSVLILPYRVNVTTN